VPGSFKMRRTKIIATIGPKTESEEMIKKLVDAGMNIARINMSHGDSKWYSTVINRINKVCQQIKFTVGIMVDTQGPEIRTSTQEFGLEEGDTFKIAVSSACDIQEGEKHTFVDYQNLIQKVKLHDTILIDDGLIALEVLGIDSYHITCKVLNKGKVGKRKSINFPGIKLDLPAITQKDRDDVKLAIENGVDYIAQSFVKKASDVKDMRKYLAELKSNASIIAKIEDQEGVDNMDEIISEADAVMVARGDLGVEIPMEEIPIVQEQIVRKCIMGGKPVIIATHLLESMIENPRPTRAEITDVANAVFQKSDCIMLSGETTKGAYPIECVETMAKISKKVQSKLRFEMLNGIKTKDVKEAITLGACVNAENLDAKAIIVFTKTGKLVSLVAKKRPNIDIFAFTEDNNVRRKLTLFWNVFPFKINFNQNYDSMVLDAVNILKQNKFLLPRDRTVIVSDVNPRKNVDILEILEID
jgi:pyruvate kinase